MRLAISPQVCYICTLFVFIVSTDFPQITLYMSIFRMFNIFEGNLFFFFILRPNKHFLKKFVVYKYFEKIF